MGAASYIWSMFIRKNKNRSGSISIQIIRKIGRHNKVIKTVGCAHTQREEELLTIIARDEIEKIEGTQSLFIENEDLIVDSFVENIENEDIQIIGPQIVLGKINGYPLGYEIFEGNKAETKTLIPVIEKFRQKFRIEKPIVVAAAALLSQKNIDHLIEAGYEFILGGRIKNENQQIKKKILTLKISENQPKEIKHINGRLIISFSSKRKKKDYRNRQRGLASLEKKVKSGKLTKENINNRGYNKYLKLKGDTSITIDYNKFEEDKSWDGLKGYITNTNLSKSDVIAKYQNLYMIEKAFKISKTDLRIRPIYHRLLNRIEAHICICFTAYAVYKELERLLKKNKIELSTEKAIEEIKDIHQLKYMLPKSKQVNTKLLRLNDTKKQIIELF